MYRSHVLVCGGTGCTSSNSLKIIERFEELIEKKRPERGNKGSAHGLLRTVRERPYCNRIPRGRLFTPALSPKT